MLWLPTRMFLLVSLWVFVTILCILVSYQVKDHEDWTYNPKFAFRRNFISAPCKYIHKHLNLWLQGFTYNVKEIDFDYSKYLGPNYEKPAKTSAIVTNHITTLTDSFIENKLWGATSVTGMVVGDSLAATSTRKIVGLIEVSRGGTEEVRN